jgi:hypothetical protein
VYVGAPAIGVGVTDGVGVAVAVGVGVGVPFELFSLKFDAVVVESYRINKPDPVFTKPGVI